MDLVEAEEMRTTKIMIEITNKVQSFVHKYL